MINILGIAHSFVDTDYCWSLNIATGIDFLSVEARSKFIINAECLIAIVSYKKLYFFKYNLKKCKEQPELIKEFDIKPEVKYILFPKDTLFGLFYEKEF